MKSRLLLPLAALAAGIALLSPQANAQDYSHIRIVRLSFVEGAVQYQGPGQDWQDARLNLPIQEGFGLRTTDGYAEVEFEDSLTLRLATNSTVEFTELALEDGGRITRLAIPSGTASISAKLKRGDALSVAGPELTVNLPHDGRFRMDVSPLENWVTVFHGKVEVDSASGTKSLLASGHTLHKSANGSGGTEIARNLTKDDFDKWVAHREDAVNSAQSETSQALGVTSYTEGFADLYNYGIWSNIPGYGMGWMPYGVGVGWMPFTYGQWQFMGFTGWNWVSEEPWGWMPYHFGSWVNSPGIGWAWIPVGSLTWVPATASWVQVNNQLGWLPNGPPLTSKPTKTQLAAAPATAILATQGTAGAIKAGAAVPLSRTESTTRTAAAPAPGYVVPLGQPTAGIARVSGSANAKIISQSTGASLARKTGGPPAVMAPHSMPAPAIARGAATAGFSRAGSGSVHAGNSSGTTSASPTAGVASSAASTQGSTSGAGSRSGGSAGSSNARH
jgi:hypothetical protein